MPLELTDFDQAGLEVDALAVIVAAAAPVVYADADRGGTQTPEGGDIGIGEGETLISRIRITNSGQNVILNDNDNPAELTMWAHFGPRNTVSPWTLYIQTDGGVVSSAQLGNVGGNYVNFRFGTEDAEILNAIGAGDRFLVAFARAAAEPANLLVAATFESQAASLSAALTKQVVSLPIAAKPVAAAFAGAVGSLAAVLTKQRPGRKPITAEFVGTAGDLAAALTKQAGAVKSIAAAFGAEAATLSSALMKQRPGVKPIAVDVAGTVGTLAAVLNKRRTDRKPIAADFDGAPESIEAPAITVIAALLAPERFLEAIAADLRLQLPKLRTCEVHDGGWDAAEVKRWPVGAPALLVAWLGTVRTEAPGLAWTDCDQRLAVYIVTADGRERAAGKLLRRGEALRNLVDWLLLYIPRARWMVRDIGPAEDLRARNLYSKAVDKDNLALAEVSWRQTVRLESGDDMDCPALPAELYASPQQDLHEQLYPEAA